MQSSHYHVPHVLWPLMHNPQWSSSCTVQSLIPWWHMSLSRLIPPAQWSMTPGRAEVTNSPNKSTTFKLVERNSLEKRNIDRSKHSRVILMPDLLRAPQIITNEPELEARERDRQIGRERQTDTERDTHRQKENHVSSGVDPLDKPLCHPLLKSLAPPLCRITCWRDRCVIWCKGYFTPFI